MAHAGKLRQRLAAHPLRGRVKGTPLWVELLKDLQGAEHAVVFSVWQLGGIQHVIQMAVVLQLRSQLRHA
jgi:hypothetical protein